MAMNSIQTVFIDLHAEMDRQGYLVDKRWYMASAGRVMLDGGEHPTIITYIACRCYYQFDDTVSCKELELSIISCTIVDIASKRQY